MSGSLSDLVKGTCLMIPRPAPAAPRRWSLTLQVVLGDFLGDHLDVVSDLRANKGCLSRTFSKASLSWTRGRRNAWSRSLSPWSWAHGKPCKRHRCNGHLGVSGPDLDGALLLYLGAVLQSLNIGAVLLVQAPGKAPDFASRSSAALMACQTPSMSRVRNDRGGLSRDAR